MENSSTARHTLHFALESVNNVKVSVFFSLLFTRAETSRSNQITMPGLSAKGVSVGTTSKHVGGVARSFTDDGGDR
jgi:hypothetical protein